MSALLAWALAAVVVAAALLACRARRAELAARAAHELRGPLTAAGLALEVRDVAAARAQLHRAAGAVEDLERAARGRGPARLRDEVDLAAVVAAEVEALVVPDGRRVRLLPAACDLVVAGDGRLLRQATANLLGNALEHGRGEVVVAARRLDGRVRVEVRDGGPGTAGARRHGRCDAVLRAGRHRRGHGLRFCAAVAARHRGVLLVAEDREGFTAVLELPSAAASARTPRGPLQDGVAA